MNTMQVVRQSADDTAVDSGMPWRLYVVDDFAFAETDDAVEEAELDVFVDMPGTDTDDGMRASDLPQVQGEDALGGVPGDRAANDDAR